MEISSYKVKKRVSDKSFGKEFNSNEYKPFHNLYPNHSEKRFEFQSMHIGWKSMRFNARHQSYSIRTKFLIRINPRLKWFRLNIRVGSFRARNYWNKKTWSRLIGLNRNRFWISFDANRLKTNPTESKTFLFNSNESDPISQSGFR